MVGTDHFARSEFERSTIAIVRGIPNSVPPHLEENAQLTLETLEAIRGRLGSAVRISSGYRSPVVNMHAAGSPKSQHMRAQAADMFIDGHGLDRMIAAIEDGDFDQLITYAHIPSIVHVSVVRSSNRRQRLHSPAPGVYDGVS